jgi:hypothetical protein
MKPPIPTRSLGGAAANAASEDVAGYLPDGHEVDDDESDLSETAEPSPPLACAISASNGTA